MTIEPSPEILGVVQMALACANELPENAPKLTRVVEGLVGEVSRTKMSDTPFVSPETRFDAALSKATYRPSAEIEGLVQSEFASTPPVEMLTRVTAPV